MNFPGKCTGKWKYNLKEKNIFFFCLSADIFKIQLLLLKFLRIKFKFIIKQSSTNLLYFLLLFVFVLFYLLLFVVVCLLLFAVFFISFVVVCWYLLFAIFICCCLLLFVVDCCYLLLSVFICCFCLFLFLSVVICWCLYCLCPLGDKHFLINIQMSDICCCMLFAVSYCFLFFLSLWYKCFFFLSSPSVHRMLRVLLLILLFLLLLLRHVFTSSHPWPYQLEA